MSSDSSLSDGYDSSSSSNEEDELEDDRHTPSSKASYAKHGNSEVKPQSEKLRGYSNEFQYSDSDESSDGSLKGKDKRGSKFAAQKQSYSKGSSKKQSSSKPKSSGPRTVPFETVTIAMGDQSVIEKLINWRMDAAGKSEEILVKYKVYLIDNMHTLITNEEHELYSRKMGPQKRNQAEFLKVDRIIDEGESEDRIFYLVKWCQQTYDLCTWEPKELIEKIDPDKIADFHKRRIFNPSKQASLNTVGKRPSPKEWRVMEESPVYKNENQLRSYQLEGLNWLLFCWYNHQNSILADEMGLGKTVQSTVFLDYIYQRLNVKGPFLIVTPLSTLGNWEREIKHWTNLNVVVYHGNDTARNLIVETEYYYRDAKNQIVSNVFKFDIILTTYEMAMSGSKDVLFAVKFDNISVSQLKPIAWRCVVLDEAHKLKNKTSKISEVLKQYKMEHRVLLTGTPLQNSVDELWSLLNFLEPEKFSSEKDFLAKFNNLTNAADVEKLQAILKPLMLRRLKEGAEDEIIKEYGADTPEKQFSALVQASGKMVLIDKLLRKLKDGGHKVLIFSQMTKCLDLIQDYLRGQRWGFERIDGSIRGDLRQACGPLIFVVFLIDWNPQNDLQAQSRVHRIGQKKPVQIYRLVTRNTYEREMFDRASLKLGLDKAILQRMDAQSAYGAEDPSDASKVAALTKTEIEELLKKGAYGAFMDDDASNQFCEEDIDQILQRRTQVIKHDNTTEKSSIFSKASFATNEEKVDLDDPDFWDKVAQRAQLNIIEVAGKGSELIVSEPRQRRQVQRFGNVEAEGDESESEVSRRNASSGADAPKLWSLAEKTRLERGLMMYGYAQWDKILELCRNRSVEDLKACSRALIKQCISSKNVELEIEQDVKACLALDGIDDVEATSFETPYPGATAKQNAEYRSFLRDAPKDYFDHLERKAKNLLSRVQMMYTIREKINITPDTKMPIIQGAPPAPWWGPEEDRDLLIGTLRHGYQQYEKIAADPNLCFASKLGIFPIDSSTLNEGERSQEEYGQLQDNKSEAEGTPSKPASSIDTILTTPDKLKTEAIDEADFKDEDMDDDDNVPDVVENSSTGFQTTEEGMVMNQFPSASDCGSRIRKVINAFLRNQALAIKDEQRRQVLEERARAKQEKEDEKVKLKERELTKKDRLVSYGVDYQKENTEIRDWTRFKEISQLRKSTDVLEEYYLRLLNICHEILDPEKVLDQEKDYDSMTPDKAKKLLKRVAAMKTLRDQVITNPKRVYEDYLEAKGIDPSTQLSRVDEGFWMKEAVAMKRFNSLCDSVINPVIRRGGGGVKRKKPATHSGSEADASSKKPATTKSRSRREPMAITLPDVLTETLGLKRKRSDRGEKSKRRKRDSNEDSDGLGENDASVKKKKKHKRKHGHREHSQRSLSNHAVLDITTGESNPLQATAEGPPVLLEDIPAHKKKKKHKKSSKPDEQGDRPEGSKKKKSKSKKKHHAEGYVSDSGNYAIQPGESAQIQI
ncbi:choline dehydrogenase 7 [Dinochytrium kinnereticum]|nr:choline dehydrogenase 7 [Dinochytrium kinnereticum]